MLSFDRFTGADTEEGSPRGSNRKALTGEVVGSGCLCPAGASFKLVCVQGRPGRGGLGASGSVSCNARDFGIAQGVERGRRLARDNSTLLSERHRNRPGSRTCGRRESSWTSDNRRRAWWASGRHRRSLFVPRNIVSMPLRNLFISILRIVKSVTVRRSAKEVEGRRRERELYPPKTPGDPATWT